MGFLIEIKWNQSTRVATTFATGPADRLAHVHSILDVAKAQRRQEPEARRHEESVRGSMCPHRVRDGVVQGPARGKSLFPARTPDVRRFIESGERAAA